MIQVRELADEDAAWERESLRRAWGPTRSPGRGVVEVLPVAGFVAVEARTG